MLIDDALLCLPPPPPLPIASFWGLHLQLLVTTICG